MKLLALQDRTVTAGQDRFGKFLMVDDFRSAMPDLAVARVLALSPEIVARAKEVLAEACEFLGNETSIRPGSDLHHDLQNLFMTIQQLDRV